MMFQNMKKYRDVDIDSGMPRRVYKAGKVNGLYEKANI